MNILRASVLLFVSFLLSINAKAQSMDFKTRNISVNTPDSIVKASVWNKTLTHKANPDYYYYWYYAGAINHNLGSYSGKLLHGKYEVFDSQQKLITQGDFEYGIMTGNWYRWYRNGNIQSVGNYKNGKLHGTVKCYANGGKQLSALTYRNGLLHGKSYFFLPDTMVAKVYKNGREVVKVKKVKQPKIKKENVKKVNPALAQKESINPQDKPKDKWWKFSFLKKKSGDNKEKKPSEGK